jgi:sugar/nucleoside kinase (ribokinase family)
MERNPGITTSLNPQYDSTEGWVGMQEVCPYLTFYIGNKLELLKIGKRSTVAESALEMLRWGCRVVVVTLGAEGAQAFVKRSDSTFGIGPISSEFAWSSSNVDCLSHDHMIVYSESCATVTVVDTTGAGDAFAGAFLTQWVTSKDIRKSLRAGCTAGTAAVTVRGASVYSEAAVESAAKHYSI